MAAHTRRKAQVLRIRATKYPDLEAFAADLTARLHAGCFAPVAGRLKLLSRTAPGMQTYPRNASISRTSNPGCWCSISMVWRR